MEQPPTGEEAGTQNKTKDDTGGVPDRKAEVLGLLISPKFPPHFIVAQHFPFSSQGEFPISLPQNSSNQKASTSLAQISGRNLFGETLTSPLQLTSRVSIAVSLSHLPEWSPVSRTPPSLPIFSSRCPLLSQLSLFRYPVPVSLEPLKD